MSFKVLRISIIAAKNDGGIWRRCTGARGPTMACEHVKLPGGGSAIVCGARRPHTKCGCGRRATLLCDWKMENPTDHKFARGSTTCDKPLCERCTTSPAPDKDLCPKHAEAFEHWKAARGVKRDDDD